MICRVSDLLYKDVINVKDGTRIGMANDLEIDTADAKSVAIVIYGKNKCFGLLGKEDDIVIPWSEIRLFGEDTILVNCCVRERLNRKTPRFFEKIFGIG